MGVQGCPNKTFREFGVPPGAYKSTKRAPKSPPGAPKRSPIESLKHLKEHLYILNLGFSKIELPQRRNQGFCRWGGRKISRNTCTDGLWWLRGALCLAMRALGEQFGVVEGSSGAKMGVQGCPNEKFGDVGVPPGAPKSTKRAPKTPPGAPKRSPREPPNTRKSIFRSQTLIFRKSSPRRSEIKVFEGRRDRLGGQNRHQEGPR